MDECGWNIHGDSNVIRNIYVGILWIIQNASMVLKITCKVSNQTIVNFKVGDAKSCISFATLKSGKHQKHCPD